MKNATGYLARWALAAIAGIGLLLLAGGGPALAGVIRAKIRLRQSPAPAAHAP